MLFHDDVISCMCNVVVGRSNWRVDGTAVKVLELKVEFINL